MWRSHNQATVDLHSRTKYLCDVCTLEGSYEKLFTTGGSQAVRLPAEFRFEGDEVEIRRDSVTGDVVLSKPIASWDEYFDWVRALDLPSDFLRERDQPEDDLCDPMPRHRRG